MRPWLLVALCLSLLACRCGEDLTVPDDPPYVPAAESCDTPDLAHPERFVPCTTGGGIFGQWALDERGLPAYDYGLDENADERARFFNTEHLDRREHWFGLGNHRLNLLAYNDGYVEVVTQDRGVTYLNKFDERHRNYAGGYSWVDDGEETWCSAYKWRPRPSHHTRRYGMGYADASSLYRGIRLSRRTLSPAGEASVVLDEVTLENTSKQSRKLKHYEYWDVGRRSIEINWVVSGIPFATAPAQAVADREARNNLFVEAVTYDADRRLLTLRRTHDAYVKPPPREKPDPADYYPPEPFLAVVAGEVSDVYVDQTPFFGTGGPGAPVAVASRVAGEGVDSGGKGRVGRGGGQTRMFVVRTDLELAPGEKKTLRFAYGTVPFGSPVALDPGWGDLSRDFAAEYAEWLAPRLPAFAAPGAPELQRELAWHAWQVEASVGYREYWGQRVVPQGSAYLYLHGADGSARDLGLFALPLVYTDPELARDELELFMKITHADDGRFSYAFQGHGMLDDALGFHAAPSDPPLFFLWLLSEYVGATGDTSLLDEKVPFYPVEAAPDATGWDHVRTAVRHLLDVVGTGSHGLIRVQTGDWSDGIVTEAPDRSLAIEKGESVPNTQMALAVLPRAAELIETRDPALAAELRSKLPGYCEAVKKVWTGKQFGRAYFGDDKLVHATYADLEAQVWPLQTDCWAAAGDREMLVATVRQVLDEPSPTGATLTPHGQVWPAISALLTWGYAQKDPELAWAHLRRDTLAAHAQTFPTLWYGIWSGPDGLKAFPPSAGSAPVDPLKSLEPGGAWHSPVTPMTDFPTQNNNAHAMRLFAALRVAGVGASARGLVVRPPTDAQPVALRTRLVDLDVRAGRMWGTYRPLGPRKLELRAPVGRVLTAVKLDGQPVSLPARAETVELPAAGSVSFEATFQP